MTSVSIPVRRSPRRFGAALAVAFATLALVGVAGTGTAAAAPARGELDPAWGSGGTAPLATGFPSAVIEAAAAQPDGKVVLVGSTVAVNDASDFLVVRLAADGSLDPTFSGDGIATTDFGGFGDSAAAVAIQPDGKIVVAGSASTAAGPGKRDNAVARYDSDGSLDGSFDGDGRQTIDFGGGSESALAVAIQPDGKVVVAGNADLAGQVDFAVARLDADGLPDPTFSGGKVTTDFHGTGDAARAVAVEPGGRIVAFGYSEGAGGVHEFALARYDADGKLDTTFSGDGTENADFTGGVGTDEPTGVALLPDGRILAGGFSGDDTDGYGFVLARFLATGGLDPSFSGDGVAAAGFETGEDVSSFIPPHDIARTALGVDPNGTAYLAGTAEYFDESFETHSEMAVAAFRSDGELDRGFSGDGRATVGFEAGNSGANVAALDSEGRLTLAGTAADGSGGSEWVSARLFALEPRPPAENPGGGSPGGSPSTPGPLPTATVSVACQRATAGLAAARKRASVAGSRLDAALRRLKKAGGAASPKREAALRRSVRKSRTRFENTKKNRARAGRKAATRC